MSKANNGLTEAYSYILFALVDPLHGYGIMQQVEAMSGGTLIIGPGTLYGALTNMEKKGWIEAAPSDEPRRKNYQLTPTGKEVVEQESTRIQLLNEAVNLTIKKLAEKAQ